MRAINKLILLTGVILLLCSFVIPDCATPGLIAISGVFNPKFTFSDTEIADFRELIFEDVFEKPQLTEFFTLMEDIKAGKKIGIVGQMSAIGRPKAACNTDETDVTIETTEKTWAPCSWGDRIPFCAADLEDQFIVWGMNIGTRRPDLTDTDYADFIAELVSDAMLESLYRVVWFGDVDAADVDASPAGQLTSGTDETLFTCHDGFWKQIFAIVAADSTRKTTNLTAKNAKATYLLQEFTDTDTTDLIVTNTFRKLIHGSHLKARSKSDRLIVCTQSVADQYSTELEQATSIPAAWEAIQKGISKIERMGITIIAVAKLDDIIRTYFDDGTRYHLPHRAVMFAKNNAAIGVDGKAGLTDFDMFYDKKSKTNYVDFLAKIDTKLLEDKHFQAAY